LTDVASPIARLCKLFPSGQFIRYVAVGCWNTLFGYCTYAALTYFLTGRLPLPYMFAAVLANVVNITVAYIGYKFIVFRTKGNYIREYLKCYVVYGASSLVGLALLPMLVYLLNLFVNEKVYVPYIAGAILTAGTVFFSFFGHREFSFKQRRQSSVPAVQQRTSATEPPSAQQPPTP
jgi:putative flippase GtrA